MPLSQQKKESITKGTKKGRFFLACLNAALAAKERIKKKVEDFKKEVRLNAALAAKERIIFS